LAPQSGDAGRRKHFYRRNKRVHRAVVLYSLRAPTDIVIAMHSHQFDTGGGTTLAAYVTYHMSGVCLGVHQSLVRSYYTFSYLSSRSDQTHLNHHHHHHHHIRLLVQQLTKRNFAIELK